MDINLLSRMVVELILDNDKVALPGIGTLVAVQMPASFSDRGYTINPPYRKLSATSDTEDDNLLTDLYSSSNGIDKESARLIVASYMGELSRELEEARCVYLPGLGKLRKTRNGSLFFVEDEDMNIDSLGYRLEPVSLKTHPAFPDIEPFVQGDGGQETLKQVQGDEEEVQGDGGQEMLKQVQHDDAQGEEETVQGDEEAGSHTHWLVKLLVWVLVLAFVALAAIAILGRVAPEIADKILYSAEELRILYY